MPTPSSWSQSVSSRLTGIDYIDPLLGGSKWQSGSISYSFADADSTWSTDRRTGSDGSSGTEGPWSDAYRGLDAAQQAAVSGALAAWAAVAGLSFTQVADGEQTVGDLRFAFTADAFTSDSSA